MQHLTTSEVVATAIFGALMVILTGAVVSAFLILAIHIAQKAGGTLWDLVKVLFRCSPK